MLRRAKSSSAIAKGDSNTPASSRKIYTFSKWLTQNDQIELVQKDIESAQSFAVLRHKLSGAEKEQGKLVVGVTALAFLNPDGQICFVHPYQILGQYKKTESGTLEYVLGSKYKGAKYTFEMEGVADAGAIVAEIDRRSLRLEKSISGQQNSSSSPAGPLPKSPRGERAAPVAFDADLDAKKPRQKVTQVQGSRFRVKLMHDGLEHKAVAMVSKDAITIVDPTTSTADDNPNSVYYRSCKWGGVVSITSSRDEVKIVSRDGVALVLVVQDAPAFIAEMNLMRDAKEKEEKEKNNNSNNNTNNTNNNNVDDDGDDDVEVLKW